MKRIANFVLVVLLFVSTTIFAQSEQTIPTPYDANVVEVSSAQRSASGTATVNTGGVTKNTQMSVAAVGKQLVITNNAQYCVVSVKVNGVEALGLGTVAFTGNTITIPFSQTGTYSVKVGLGFLNSNNTPNISFLLSYSNVTIALASNTNLAVNRFSLFDIMCLGSTTTKTWQSEFQGIGDSYRIVFDRPSRSMKLFRNNVQVDSGSPLVVTWTNQTNKYSSSLPITFQIKSTYQSAIIDYPYGRFMMRINGVVYNFIKQ